MFKCRERFKDIPLTIGVKIIYQELYNCLGPQHWWPGETELEIIVGAILTQGVNWGNVEKAINNLKKKKLLTAQAILQVKEKELAELIRPTGYYNMKARKLKAFINFLFERYDGKLDIMFTTDLDQLRSELLGVYGIGPETADSILLYAGNYPVFVIDAYTRRIFNRLGYIEPDLKYDEIQQLIFDNFPEDVNQYNEYHALLVALGKDICKNKKPRCRDCPLS